MTKRQLSKRAKRRLGVISIALGIAIAVLGTLSFRSSLEENLLSNASQRLFDMADANRQLLVAQLSGMSQQLHTTSVRLSRTQGLEQAQTILEETLGTTDLIWSGVGNTQYQSWFTDGRRLDLSDCIPYQQALAGQPAIYDTGAENPDSYPGQRTITLMQPIQSEQGEVVGVAMGGYPAADLTRYAQNAGARYRGFALVLRRDGQLIASAGQLEGLSDLTSLQQLLENAQLEGATPQQVMEQLPYDIKETLVLTYRGEKLLAYYMPLQMNDWYLFSAIPYRVVADDTRSISREAYRLALLLLVLFGLGAAWVLYSNRRQMEKLQARQQELRTSEARYRLLMEQSQDIILEYDLRARLVTYCENADLLREPLLRGTGFLSTLVERGMVHPEEAGLLHDALHRVNSGGPGEQLELRLKLEGDVYCWYRLNLACVTDDDGQPCKVLVRAQDIHQQKLEQARLHRQAQRDPLTGLLNKGATVQEIDRLLACDPQGPHAIMIVDLDNFKQANDCYGHLLGDQLLVAAAQCLEETFRSSDVLGRIGGDELMAFCRGVDSPEAATKLAERLCQRFRALGQDCGTLLTTSCSVGIAMAPSHGTTFQRLYQNADLALYQVKDVGKDGFALFDPLSPHTRPSQFHLS